MLGSVAEAEDVVQDSFLRWQGADTASLHEPRAYLARIVTRLCLDRLKSARARREHYVGTWLPEPLVEDVTAQRVADDLDERRADRRHLHGAQPGQAAAPQLTRQRPS